jgi:hypothetical protein
MRPSSMWFVSSRGLVLRRAALASVLLSACTAEPDHVVENMGELCAYPSAAMSIYGPQTYVAGTPVLLKFSLDTFPNNCITDIETSCDLERTSRTLHFNTRVSWNDLLEGVGCTREARRAEADCAADPLAAGSYSLVLGPHTTTLAIPGETTTAPCVVSDP